MAHGLQRKFISPLKFSQGQPKPWAIYKENYEILKEMFKFSIIVCVDVVILTLVFFYLHGLFI